MRMYYIWSGLFIYLSVATYCPSNDIQTGSFNLAITSTNFGNPSKRFFLIYLINMTFATAKSDTNYQATITIQRFNYVLNETSCDFRNQVNNKGISVVELKFLMWPVCNFRTWIVRYMVIPSSITAFKFYQFALILSTIPPGSSYTSVQTVPYISLAGGCVVTVILEGMNAAMADSTHHLSISYSGTMLSSTSMQIVMANKSGKVITYAVFAIGALYFNKAQVANGITLASGAILTASYGTISYGGNTFSDKSITNSNVFFGITEFAIYNTNLFDIWIEFSNNTLRMSSTSTSIPLMNVGYIVFQSKRYAGNTCCSSSPLYVNGACYDSCPFGYFNSTPALCLACQHDCYACNNTDNCTLCNTTAQFRTLNASTLRCDPMVGYYDNGTGLIALACSSHCILCTNSTVCVNCLAPYSLENGTCFINCSITNCLACSVNMSSVSVICVNCIGGYSLSNNSCWMCGDGNFSVMKECEDGNLINGDGCSYNCVIQPGFNCSVVGSLSVCCPNYCSSCINNTKCISCYNGSYLMLGNLICVSSCPSTYFQDTINYICVKCMDQCLSCNRTTCFRCQTGFPTIGGCTNISGCLQINNSISAANNCLRCDEPSYSLSGGVCTCYTGYWEVTSHCTNVLGCLAAYKVNGSTFCIGCNIAQYFTLVNQTCVCTSGLQFDSTAKKCVQICGDGLLQYYECDDGNLINGDGCSSLCKVQKYFICENGTTQNPSVCVYVKKDLKLTQLWSNKSDNVNEGVFYFEITPALVITDRSDFVTSVDFQCQPRTQSLAWSYSNSKLTLRVTYLQDLESRSAMINVSLSSSTNVPTLSLNFTMISKGAKLIIYKKYWQIQHIHLYLEIISFVILGLFIVSNCTHKMIGVETIHTYQLIYCICLFTNNRTEPYLLFRFLTFTNLNLLYYVNHASNYMSRTSPMDYSSDNEIIAKLIIFGLIFIPIILNLFHKALQIAPFEEKVQCLQRHSKRLYKVIVFPIVIGFMFEILALKTPSQRDFDNYYYLFLDLILRLGLSVIFFQELKLIFLKSRSQRFFGMKEVSSRYIPIYLSYSLSLKTAIIATCLGLLESYLLCSLTIIAIFLVWYAKNMPYNSNIHNAGQITNLILLLVFVGWSCLRLYVGEAVKEENQILIIFVICILMLTSMLLMAIRIILEIRNAYRIKNQKSKMKELKKEEDLGEKRRREMLNYLNKYNKYIAEVQGIKARMLEWNEVNRERMQDFNGNTQFFDPSDLEEHVSKLQPFYLRRDKRQRPSQSKEVRKYLTRHPEKKIQAE